MQNKLHQGNVDGLTFDEMCTLMHGLCNQANKLRERIRYVQAKIEERAKIISPELRLVTDGGNRVPEVNNGAQG